MAKSGRIDIIQNSQNIANNTSNITVNGIITTSGDSWRGDQRTGIVTVYQGGTAIHSSSFTNGAPKNSTTTLFSIVLTVTHNSDGTSGAITATYNYDNGWCTGSGSLSLSTIPRVSTPTLNSTLFTITKSNSNYMRVYTNRKSTGFTHHIYYSFNGSSEACIATGVSDYYDWYFPDTLANSIPNNYLVNGYIRLYTFNGSTNLGSKTVSFQMQLSNEFVPTVSIDVSDNNGYFNIFGKYIQGRSAVKVVATASGCYGSSIKSYSTNVNGNNYSGTEIVSSLITEKQDFTVTTTVTDSRNRSGYANTSIPVYEYHAPMIKTLSAKRCNADGTMNSGGEYLAIIFTSSVTGLDGQNTSAYTLIYKKSGDTSETTVDITSNVEKYENIDTVYIIPAEKLKSYEISLYISDAFSEKFGSTYKNTTGSSVSKLFSILSRGLGIAFGKVAALEGVFDIAFKTRFTGGILQPVINAETDLNDVLLPNTYSGLDASTSGYVNCPISEGKFTLEVISANDDSTEGSSALTQRLTRCVKDESLIYERHYYDDTWGDWIKLSLGFTPIQQGGGIGQSDNKVKIGWSPGTRLKCTVDSTDLGNFVFDEDVCTYGTANYGNYYKFADGTLICAKSVWVDISCSNAWGTGLYDSPGISLGNWPCAFTDIPYTSMNYLGVTGGFAFLEGLNDLTATTVGITYLCRGSAAALTGRIHVIGIGRWK